MSEKTKLLSNSVLKIIALISMTLDHIGVCIANYYPTLTTLWTIFRIIGRIALPLFCYLVVEGMKYSKNKEKYMIRLGIMAILISIFLVVTYYVPSLGMSEVAYGGNIFIDLLFGAIMIYLLDNKNPGIKILAILPFAVSVLSFVAKCYEMSTPYNASWYPPFLRMQYDVLSLVMMLGFWAAKYMAKLFYDLQSNFSGVPSETKIGTDEFFFVEKLMCFVVVLVSQILYYLVYYMNASWVFWNKNIQLWGILGGLFIIFYSGKRGYNKKWFQYGCYIYYPLHLVIIFGIFYLINL